MLTRTSALLATAALGALLLIAAPAHAQKSDLMCELCKATCSTLASEACGSAAGLMCSSLDLDQKSCKKVGELLCEIGTSAVDNAYSACGGLCAEINICSSSNATLHAKAPPSSASSKARNVTSDLANGDAFKDEEMYEDAIFYYERACEQRAARGCREAAFIQDAPKQRPRFHDEVRATQLYYEGCSLGDKRSCFNLGHQFEKGLGGLKPNLDVAESHYRQACRQGVVGACKRRKALCADGFSKACR